MALLDADEQKTSSTWVRNAEPGITIVTATEMDAIQSARAELQSTHEIIVADTPGKEGDAARTVTFLADLAILPLQPSKPDIRAIKDALKVVRLAQEVTGGKRPEALFVLNLVAKGGVQSRALREQLSESGYQVAESEIRRLNAIRDACDSAVTRLPGLESRGAASDMDSLFSEILGKRVAKLLTDARTALKRSAANG